MENHLMNDIKESIEMLFGADAIINEVDKDTLEVSFVVDYLLYSAEIRTNLDDTVSFSHGDGYATEEYDFNVYPFFDYLEQLKNEIDSTTNVVNHNNLSPHIFYLALKRLEDKRML